MAQAISTIQLLMNRQGPTILKSVASLHPQPLIIEPRLAGQTVLRLAGLACEEASKAMGLGEFLFPT